MNQKNKTPNHLIHEKSPYLLQHAYNPVDWYPWCSEAFSKAKWEKKPIFLSIGYSTCHWCHVMAHESFENEEIADILNQYFIAIKVDREERPDLDSIYMSVCQAFTGSGGWPTSIFMTSEQKPFFAGTYFPRSSSRGMIGFEELLFAIHQKWENEKETLLQSADELTTHLNQTKKEVVQADERLVDDAIQLFRQSYDKANGGFGNAPKFPTPHNLLFLMQQYEKLGNKDLLDMVENTLQKMYAGGMFDHIGYGFCRYSTDEIFLVPHFEKMLYDNALLILAYCKAYEITQKDIYKEIAEKTAFYILGEMVSEDGGFYSAQDADSDGVEGKYYLLQPDEITSLLGKEEGDAFNKFYGITGKGNFEGQNIPNRLHDLTPVGQFDSCLPSLREYRRNRCSLHTDDKILTVWNSLTISALCSLYRISHNPAYLTAAKKAYNFIETNLCSMNTLFVSTRNGERGEKGFLDDYANYIFALIFLYEATLDQTFLNRAMELAKKAICYFFDKDKGGFFLYGEENEALIFRPKECHDGAMPSGNSVMANCLVMLNTLTPDSEIEEVLEKQLAYLSGEAESYPSAYSMFLMALSDSFNSPATLTVVPKEKEDIIKLPLLVPLNTRVRVLYERSKDYLLANNKTTYYVCRNQSCLPPTNEFDPSIWHTTT